MPSCGESGRSEGPNSFSGLLPRRLIDDRVILRDRGVERPPRRLLDSPPRRWPPAYDLADPRMQGVAAMEEGRSPSLRVAGEREVVPTPRDAAPCRRRPGRGMCTRRA